MSWEDFKIAFCHLGDENPKIRELGGGVGDVRAHARVSAIGVGFGVDGWVGGAEGLF